MPLTVQLSSGEVYSRENGEDLISRALPAHGTRASRVAIINIDPVI